MYVFVGCILGAMVGGSVANITVVEGVKVCKICSCLRYSFRCHISPGKTLP